MTFDTIHHGASRALVLAACIAVSASGRPAYAAESIEGCWIIESGQSVIELSVDAGILSGRIVGLESAYYLADEDGPEGALRVDLKNDDPALRSRPLAGMELVSNLTRRGEEWRGGEIYDPESGNTYSVRLRIDDDGSLNIRGYVGTPLFGRTTRWTPAASDPSTRPMIETALPVMPQGAPPANCTVDDDASEASA